MSVPDIISVADAAELLRLTEQSTRTLVRRGKIEGQQIGKQWVISRDAVLAYRSSLRSFDPPDQVRSGGKLPEIRALSFFSGAMGLDLGLEQAGIEVLLACEFDRACRRTISTNRPQTGLIGDIWKYTIDQIREFAGLSPKDRIDVVVGGPPCQAFSTAGARRGFGDQRGSALLRYLEVIDQLRPTYAVLENVRGLLSAPLVHTPHAERTRDWKPTQDEMPGGALLHIIDSLRSMGYCVSFNLYNSANFGVPQARERVVLIACRGDRAVPHLVPTHSADGSFGLPKWRTFKDAVDSLTQEHDHDEFPEERLRFYRLLGPGQYWKHLPAELQKEALGGSYYSGGGKTGFLRRLAWDKPSCTLVTSPCMPATDICHPVEDRPLSVQEYKRIQEFPDEWIVCGTRADQYKQIGNAVPLGLGRAVGTAILNHMNGQIAEPPAGFQFSRYKNTDEVSWEQATRSAIAPRAKGKRQRVEDAQQMRLVE